MSNHGPRCNKSAPQVIIPERLTSGTNTAVADDLQKHAAGCRFHFPPVHSTLPCYAYEQKYHRHVWWWFQGSAQNGPFEKPKALYDITGSANHGLSVQCSQILRHRCWGRNRYVEWRQPISINLQPVGLMEHSH